MYLYKSLFSINKLNQNLVSFACSHFGAGWYTRLIHAKVRGGMGLFHLQRRFVFAQDQVSMSSKVRLVIYICSIVFCIETTSSNVSLYRIDLTCVTNRLRVVSKRLVSKLTTLYRNDRVRSSFIFRLKVQVHNLFF